LTIPRRLQRIVKCWLDFPSRAGVRERFQHVWDRYVIWGVTNPAQQRALRQMTVWSGLTEVSKRAGIAPFLEIEKMAEAAVAQHLFLDRPLEFIRAAMGALADTTMEFMRRDPDQAEIYRRKGFEMLWAGVTRKK
jgi:hypothetical protein